MAGLTRGARIGAALVGATLLGAAGMAAVVGVIPSTRAETTSPPTARPTSTITTTANPTTPSHTGRTAPATRAAPAITSTVTMRITPTASARTTRAPVRAVTRAAVVRAIQGRCDEAPVRIETMLAFDYTDDGVKDAVVHVGCVVDAGSSPSQLLAFAATSKGPRLTQTIISAGQEVLIDKIWLSQGRFVTVQNWTYADGTRGAARRSNGRSTSTSLAPISPSMARRLRWSRDHACPEGTS